MLCISAAYAAMRCLSVCLSMCPSVCLSRSWVASKRIDNLEIFSPSGSHTILVFPCQTRWRYSDGNLSNGAVECRWGRQKTRFWTSIWFRCIRVYSVQCYQPYTLIYSRELWKTKPRRTAASVAHSPRRPSSVVRTRRRRSVCDGLDVIRRRGGQPPPPNTTPLVIIPVFCCRRTS